MEMYGNGVAIGMVVTVVETKIIRRVLHQVRAVFFAAAVGTTARGGCRVANRGNRSPGYGSYSIGFRLALVP